MKYFLCLSLLAVTSVHAKSIKDFNQVINQDVKSEIRKDEDKFKKVSSRSPASVKAQPEGPTQETPKIDKNVRQIGPNEW